MTVRCAAPRGQDRCNKKLATIEGLYEQFMYARGMVSEVQCWSRRCGALNRIDLGTGEVVSVRIPARADRCAMLARNGQHVNN